MDALLCNPEGYRYSRFCELYRAWERKLSVTMCHTHVGDLNLVHFIGNRVITVAGQTIDAGSHQEMRPGRPAEGTPPSGTALFDTGFCWSVRP
jgi:hypothetical protein